VTITPAQITNAFATQKVFAQKTINAPPKDAAHTDPVVISVSVDRMVGAQKMKNAVQKDVV